MGRASDQGLSLSFQKTKNNHHLALHGLDIRRFYCASSRCSGHFSHLLDAKVNTFKLELPVAHRFRRYIVHKDEVSISRTE